LRENRFRGSPVPWWELKRDVVGCFSLGRVGAIAEQAELPRHDFSPGTLAASVLGFVLAASEPSFDVNLTAFAEEPIARIGQRSEMRRSDANRYAPVSRRCGP
jgi:hypothetical protein